MNNQQILEAAIKKAWLKVEEIYYHESGNRIVFDTDETAFDMDIDAFIFSHEFAKAFWGNGDACDKCGFSPSALNLPKGLTANCSHKDSVLFIEGFKYHLQQMVLEKDRIKYLEQFLK